MTIGPSGPVGPFWLRTVMSAVVKSTVERELAVMGAVLKSPIGREVGRQGLSARAYAPAVVACLLFRL
jgi:hypothetical protein